MDSQSYPWYSDLLSLGSTFFTTEPQTGTHTTKVIPVCLLADDTKTFKPIRLLLVSYPVMFVCSFVCTYFRVGDFFDFVFKSKKSDLFDLNQIFFI